MSFESFIGWRYLKAKRRQTFISLITIISLAGVALGVASLIVVLAVMNGFENDLKTKILGVNSHIVVLKSSGPLEDYQSLSSRIEAVEGVTTAVPFVYSQIMLGNLGSNTGAVIRGIDPALSAKKGVLGQTLIRGDLKDLEGRPDAEGEVLPGIMLGVELAKQISALEGDVIQVISPLGQVTPLGGRAPKVGAFIVVGLFESGMYEYDSTLAYLSLKQAQKFLNLGRAVTGIEVKVDDIYQADKLRGEIIEKIGPGYWAKDWMQMNRNLFSALKLEKTAMFIILTLTVLVAAFNIVSTLIMVVMEKNRDIAILKSIGADARSIMKIFVFQGLLIGVLGTILGLLGGVGLCGILARYEFIKLPSDVYYITTVPVRMEAFDVGLVTFSAVLISFFATLYPAWQASRLNPVEAFRYE